MERTNPASPGSDPSHELTDLRWLGALAHRLVSDPGLADDACQEAWLAASRGGTVAVDRRGLAFGLRQFLWLSRRSDRRRQRREAEASRRESLPSTAELIEVGEQRQRVWEHLKQIDEPFRSTLLLRFQEELATDAIAAREGLRPDTVRRRIRVGLERLRESLERDRDRGGLRAVALAIPASIRTKVLEPTAAPAAGSAALGLGALVMFKLATALVVGVSAVTWLVLRPSAPRELETARDGAPTQPSSRSDVELVLESEPDAKPTRRELSPEGGAPTSASPAAPAVLVGRVVDAEGRPRPAVEARLRARSLELTDVSDADGRFRLPVAELEVPVLYLNLGGAAFAEERRFELGPDEHGSDFALPDRTPGAVTDLGEIVLADAGRVRGRVVESTGSPIPNARIDAAGSDWVYAGATGDFVLDHVTPGSTTVDVSIPGWLDRSVAVDVAPRGDHDVGVIELTVGPRVRGRVIDQDGHPVSTARVGRDSGDPLWMFPVDDEGRFDVPLPRSSSGALRAQAWGYHDPYFPIAVRPGAVNVELVLERRAGAPGRVRVVDAISGAPIDYVVVDLDTDGVRLRGDTPGPRIDYDPYDEQPTDDGWLSFVAEANADVLDIVAEGFAPVAAVVAPAASGDGQIVELRGAPAVRGRVVRAGRPVAGAEVVLHYAQLSEVEPERGDRDPVAALEAGPLTERWGDQEFKVSTPVRVVDPAVDGPAEALRLLEVSFSTPTERRSTRTDADGRFEFERAPLSALRIVARDPASGDALRSELVTPIGYDDLELGDLSLAPTGAIDGQLVAPAGGPLGGHRVHIAETGPYEALTDVDGRFRIDDLPAGSYLLTVAVEATLIHDNWSTNYHVRVPAGGTREAAIEIEAWSAAAVDVRVGHNGAPLGGAYLRLGNAGLWSGGETLDDDGTATFVVPAGMPLTPSVQIDRGQLTLGAPTTFATGRGTLELSIETGSLAVTLPPELELPPHARTRLAWTAGPEGPAMRALDGRLSETDGAVAHFGAVPAGASNLVLDLLGGSDPHRMARIERWPLDVAIRARESVEQQLP